MNIYRNCFFVCVVAVAISCKGPSSEASTDLDTYDSASNVTSSEMAEDTLYAIDSSAPATSVPSLSDADAPSRSANDSTKINESLAAESEVIPQSTIRPREAVFGYSFFKKIQQHETRPVHAVIFILNKASEVIDTLRDINAIDRPERKSDTAEIFTKNMFVFKALTIYLQNAGDSDFIIRAHGNAHQIIDSIFGNSWEWSVTPRTNKKRSRLIMEVIVENIDGKQDPFKTIHIPIEIQLDKQLGRSIWDWMMNNPEKVLTVILIPLIIFSWRRISDLLRKRKEK